ncbi:MAG: Gfo/Idh/MocA family protein [Planctomycetota bacterium]|jgi:predicted dehydrogenase
MSQKPHRRLNRRTVVKGIVAGAVGGYAGVGLPGASYGQKVQGKKTAPKGPKLNVAVVGVGNMGSYATKLAGQENPVAFCDVDWRPKARFGGSRVPLDLAAEHPQTRRFTDFRVMLDQVGDDIDCVLVSTPDHTHFAVGMAAMERGKHVFIQKPLTHNIWQSRTIKKAAVKHGVHTVMGNQGHTWEATRLIVEWVRQGMIGDVQDIHCWTDRPVPNSVWFKRPAGQLGRPAPVPEGLDWDAWQGPVAPREYSPDYLPQKWRGWWDYGCGGLGDIGCHTLDTPFWALDLRDPERVEVVAIDDPMGDHYTPWGAHIIYHFGRRGDRKPLRLHWWEGTRQPEPLEGMDKLPSNGMYMIGTKEILYAEGMRPRSPQLWPRERTFEYKDILKNKYLPRAVGGPIEELFAAMRGRIETPGSHFGYAAELTELVQLGALAIRSGKSFAWDAKTMKTSVPELNKWIDEPARDRFDYGRELWV